MNAGKMSDRELLVAFLNDFDGYSSRDIRKLIREHAKRVLKNLGVNEKYRIIPNKHINSFECDENKRVIRYSSDFISKEKPGSGISAYLLVCHEAIHARQDEHYRSMLKGNVALVSSDLNRMDRKFAKSQSLNYQACGYVKHGIAFLVPQKNTRAGIDSCYYLQPSEFEAYRFQYQKAAEILDMVLNKKNICQQLSTCYQ